ncbi:MAG: discoidin domain-containing protein [Lachnospiraceae bacterium]|nr:discoidin domain-containing protein [Lachnospiraceae bacterium]
MGLESEKAFPFDAEKDSMGNYDRIYYADDFARYFRSFISSGIFLKEHDNLQVIANDDMSVTIRPGAIIIDGYHYENTEDIIVQLDPADGVLNRIDRISISWIKEERDAHKIVQKGESSYEPISPECRRNAEYKDYVLADVYVAAGVIKITQDNITDQRLNTDVCGLAIAFSEIDTTLIFSQLQAFYEKVKSENADWAKEKQEAFDKWFENIKNQLEGDVAANLQKQIGALANLKTTDKSDLVSAINELAEKEIDVLDTMEEVEANTDPGKVAGALALKEVNDSLGDISGFTNEEYSSLGAFLQYCVDNGYLPDVNLVALIPLMTSNSYTYSGTEYVNGTYVASAISEYSGRSAYKAFNGSATNADTNIWTSNSQSPPIWLQIELPSAVSVKKAKIKTYSVIASTTCKLQGSNDGTNFTDISSTEQYTTNDFEIATNTNTKYKYFRLYISAQVQTEGTYKGDVVNLQLYN